MNTKADLTTFAMEALADFRTVGSIAPSSRFLTQAMLAPLVLRRARVVVEVGSGTGVVTQALLNLIPQDASLLAVEINPRFAKYLKERVKDPRLTVITASAAKIRKEVNRRGHKRVDAVISSLALSLMALKDREAFLGSLESLLDETGVFTQYQYFHGMQWQNGRLSRFHLDALLRRTFRHVQRQMIWRNLPPAFVFDCRGPIARTSA